MGRLGGLVGRQAAAMSFEMSAQIEIEDKRLAIGLKVGQMLVAAWAIVIIFVHAEYFLFLPIMPVSQGGLVNDQLGYSASNTCTQAQNAHCNDAGTQCTVITPDEIVPDGTVYKDQLYVTTKIDMAEQLKTCAGTVSQGLCIGTSSDAEVARFTVYTAGLELLHLNNRHAMRNPTRNEPLAHCEMDGSMKMATILSSACADATTDMQFADAALVGGTCWDGDVMTVGQLLRSTDYEATDGTVLGSSGEIKKVIRDSGALIHVKVVYSNSASDTAVKYEYSAAVIARDESSTVRKEIVMANMWQQQSAGTWVKNQTTMIRHGLVFSFSQEGLVGESNINTLAVHLMAINGMIGVVTTIVTLIAQNLLKYENKIMDFKTLENGEKEVSVYNGHGFTKVPDPNSPDAAEENAEQGIGQGSKGDEEGDVHNPMALGDT